MSRITNNLFGIWRQREADTGQRLTYAMVSEATGISEATLSRWMKGQAKQFDARTIRVLCEFFECRVMDLIIEVADLEDLVKEEVST